MDGEDIGFPIVLCGVVLCFISIVAFPLVVVGLMLWKPEGSHDNPQTAPDGSVLCEHGVSSKGRHAARQRLIDKGIVPSDRWENQDS